MNTLALKTNADTHEKLTIAEQYQALADAGLLASYISLHKNCGATLFKNR